MNEDKLYSAGDLFDKAEWEGGFYDLATGYGLPPSSVVEGPVRDAYASFFSAAKSAAVLEDELNEVIESSIDDA